MLLLVLMLLPVVGALVLYPLRHNVQLAKQTAMGFALAEVVLVVVVWFDLLGARRRGRRALPAGVRAWTGSRRSAPGSRWASTASRWCCWP